MTELSSTLDVVPSARGARLRAHADAVFEQVSPYSGFGFRHHCRRLFRFATMLLERDGLRLDYDVAYMIAMWHDLGILSERDEGHHYLQRSVALFERETRDLNLGETPPQILRECILYNHRLMPVPNLSPVAECFRRAVLMEHSRGFCRFGLDRASVAKVFEEYPRGNFDRVLLDFAFRTLRREPLSLVTGIFFGLGHTPIAERGTP